MRAKPRSRGEILQWPITASPSGGLARVVVGRLVARAGARSALVEFSENDTGAPIRARATFSVLRAHVGGEVTLGFEEGDAGKPIITGFLGRPGEEEAPLDLDVDGTRLLLTGREEIILRCGKASITLNRAGRVIIKGAYVVSHASGTNRIRGGAVQIN